MHARPRKPIHSALNFPFNSLYKHFTCHVENSHKIINKRWSSEQLRSYHQQADQLIKMRTGMMRRCGGMAPLCAALYLVSLTSLAVLADASNFCVTAMNKKLCEETVKGAADWNQAITKAVTIALKQIEKVDHGQVKTSIHQTKSASVGSAVDRMCTEAYANAKDLLQESLELIRNGDKTSSLNFKLSAALTSLEDCDNAFDDFKVDVASVQALNNDIDQAIRVCLAVDKSKSAARK